MEAREVWYLAEGSYGFTSLQGQAQRDQHGAPIIAQGYLRELARLAERASNDIIELGADNLEILKEITESVPSSKSPPLDRRSYRLGVGSGLAAALATLRDPDTMLDGTEIEKKKLIKKAKGAFRKALEDGDWDGSEDPR